MPTPPRSYSPSAAEKLRLALLALAASATVAASAQDLPDDDPAETDVLGEIPEDIEEGGDIGGVACPKKGCDSEDCWCDGPCEEGKPCTDCDTQSDGEKEESHAENAETQSHAESAESADTQPHAESAEGAESGGGSGEAKPSPSVASAPAATAVQALARAMSEKAGYPVPADLVVSAARRLNQDPEEYARKMLAEIGAGAASTNAPAAAAPAPSNQILVLGRRR